MTAERPSVNWIHVLMEQDAAEGQNVTEILYYVEKTVLSEHSRGSGASSPGSLASSNLWIFAVNRRKQFREPNPSGGVQEHEDARTSHPCERRARDCKATLSLRELARQF